MAEGPVQAAGDAAKAAAQAPAKAAKGAGGFLRGKMFGMPRWAFLGLLAGGLVLGLYLRMRSAGEEEVPPEDEEYVEPYADDPIVDPDAGAGYGILGPSQGQVVPVETPLIPEGFETIIGDLVGGLVDQTGYLTEIIPGAQGDPTSPGSGAGVTGGGPPNRPAGAHGPFKGLTAAQQQKFFKFLRAGRYDRAQKVIERHGTGGGPKPGSGGRDGDNGDAVVGAGPRGGRGQGGRGSASSSNGGRGGRGNQQQAGPRGGGKPGRGGGRK